MKKSLMMLCALPLFGCDEAVPSADEPDSSDVTPETDATSPDVPDVEDVAAADAGEDTPDAVPDAEPDLEEDIEIEVPPDAPADTPDVGDADASDALGADAEDVADTGTACDGEDEVCDEGYVCIDGACQFELSEETWAESDFDITEPEELASIFEIFKTFASDVKFLVLDFDVLSGSVDAEYGTANIIDEEVEPVTVAWQTPEDIDTVRFAPARDADPLAGDSWRSDTFLYELRASATIEFPGAGTITADFGLDALDVTIQVWVHPEIEEGMTGQLVGIVTREETESRDLGTAEEFERFEFLLCDDGDYEPGVEWQLSDVLDCNGAALDADSDGDGVNDGYRVVIDAIFEPAELVP